MDADPAAALPDDVDALKAALLLARADLVQVTAKAAVALAEHSSNLALIAHLKLQISLKLHLFMNKLTFLPLTSFIRDNSKLIVHCYQNIIRCKFGC